jgi:hypothetical protein
VIAADPELRRTLLYLGEACRDLRDWAHAAAPRLPDRFAAHDLANLPEIVARQSARRWLIDRGVPPHEISSRVIEHLMEMARDAASPPRAQLPGALLVRRRRGLISAAPSAGAK